jgi:SAM-dependent methyltransferase
MLKAEVTTMEAAFEAKAERYARAMNRHGGARILELAPMFRLLKGPGVALLDLFSGPGFVSKYFSDQFHDVVLVDQVGELLSNTQSGYEVFPADASDRVAIRDLMNRFDVAICLAGLHHVLPDNFRNVSPENLKHTRLKTLEIWRDTLQVGGRLIIADVPAAGCNIIPELPVRLGSLSKNSSLAVALGQIGNLDFNSHQLDRSEPAEFFDEFVVKHCPNGHDGVFESLESLSELMSQAGFQNIQASTVQTPWIFPSLDDAVWFLHELFAIGDTAITAPDKLPEDQYELVFQSINQYLGCLQLENGRFAVGWKLLYVTGERT